MNNLRDMEEFMRKYNEYITNSYPKFMISQYIEPKVIHEVNQINIPPYGQMPMVQGVPGLQGQIQVIGGMQTLLPNVQPNSHGAQGQVPYTFLNQFSNLTLFSKQFLFKIF